MKLKYNFRFLTVLFLVLFLSACMYPESEEPNQMPNESQIEMVQQAVEQYREDTDGLLPIKTVSETREYFEYQVDFDRLVPEYMDERPPISYEGGGYYQFVILDAEENPTVKLADLRITEEIRSLQLRVNGMGEHVQFEETIGPNVYKLDLDFYNLEENPTVTSPISGGALNVYYSGGENFIVDYREDIGRIIEDNDLQFETGDDVREVLYEYTPIVPIYSPEITVDENNDPIFMTNVHKSA
ncbi:hypothetical protein [Salinicoccus sp. YB14-2]|uniref:hypothetical protein n=1 Tax=Salinicoccus sp. YB14-2 TaxID=1572701 RepID=UPI00068B3CFC|nr:hypothetical protein [Salinicoccus sp. YB14-2]